MPLRSFGLSFSRIIVSVVLSRSPAVSLQQTGILCLLHRKPLQKLFAFLSRHERALTLGTTARWIDLTHTVHHNVLNRTRLKWRLRRASMQKRQMFYQMKTLRQRRCAG
jgi:hypothetical protein